MGMKKLIVYIIIVCACASNVWAQTYDELVEKSFHAIEVDSLEAAQDYLLQALKVDPDNSANAMLLSNMGTVQRRRHLYEQALESYTNALNIMPESIPILLNRAALYVELSKLELAKQDYTNVLHLSPNNEEALSMRAYLLVQQRKFDEAKADYDILLRNNPKNFNAQLGLSTLFQKTGRYDEAYVILTGMIVQAAEEGNMGNRQLAMLYVARAGIENDLQHTQQALLDLEQAISLDQNLPDIYLLRGQIYLSLKRGDLAKADFERCVKLGIPMADMRELIRQCR